MDNLMNKYLVIKYLRSIECVECSEYLISLYSYEYQIYKLINKNVLEYNSLIERRVSLLKKIFTIIYNDRKKILNYNFKISQDIILIKSKFNWSLFCKLDFDCFNSIIKFKSTKHFNILVRQSFIEDAFFDEILLDIDHTFLIDIIKYKKAFIGYDFVSKIFNFINENEKSLNVNEKIIKYVANSLIYYIIYFNALIIE